MENAGITALRYLRASGQFREFIGELLDDLTPQELAFFERRLTRERWRNKVVPVLTLDMAEGQVYSIRPRPSNRSSQSYPIAFGGLIYRIANKRRVRDLTNNQLLGMFALIEYCKEPQPYMPTVTLGKMFSNTQIKALKFERKYRKERGVL